MTQGLNALFAGRRRGRTGVISLALGLALIAAVAPRAVGKESTSTPIKKPAGNPDNPQVALINDQIRAGWESNGLTASAAATDGEWCRRVFLDVLGRIPTVDELKQFLDEPAHERKVRLVNRILGDDYVEAYARNWTSIWTNVLIGRSGGTERRSLVNREGLQQSLRRALERDMPYDKLVYELVSAHGVSKPGKDDFNGFVNFMAGNLQENAVQATAKTSQIFLGLQIQCTQCHNHPFNDWKQNRFWELNAFFRQSKALKRFEKGRDIDCIELVNQDFAGENNHPEEAAIFYEFRNGVSKVAFPVFVDGTKLASDSGFVRDVDRRTELAKLIVASEYMPRALVNRYWAHFFGYGFTKPIDDMGPHNAPSHPELLDALSEQFKSHSYSLKDLVRWIVLSEPYGLSSKMTPKNKKDDPALGEKPMFSHFYLRQMRAEELFESLKIATEAQDAEGSYEKREAAKRQWLEQFTVAFGTDDNEETTTFNGTIPQTLMMMNGDMIQKATSVDKGGFLHRIAMDAKLNNKARINYLYMAALARTPTNQETALANELMAYRHGDPVAALQDVWWAVLNSNEFILNH